jgi:hypothetical protein
VAHREPEVEAVNIILVHIGESLPPYFWQTVEQVRRWSGQPIWTVIPEKFCGHPEVGRIGVNAVSCESLWGYSKNQRFDKQGALKGFWDVTARRLILVEALADSRGLTDILHIENDVLIYRDPLDLHHLFIRYAKEGVLVAPVGSTHGSAAYMFSPSVGPLAWLNERLVESAEGDLQAVKKKMGVDDVSEMVVLAYLWRRLDKHVIYLPVLPYGMGSQGIELFKSLFDGASWGQYAGGTPQGHGPGVTFDHHWVGQAIRRDGLKLRWERDPKGRNTVYVVRENLGRKQEWRLNNIHVHSKKVKGFM